MTAPMFLSTTVLIVAISARALSFTFRYFTSFEGIDSQDADQRLFALVATLSLIFSGFLLANDIIGLTREMPMSVFPFEHQYSLLKTEGYFVTASLSLLLATRVTTRKTRLHVVPGRMLVLLSSLGITLTGLFFFYVSTLGYCCESPLAIFVGFPFSQLHGISGLDYAAGRVLSHLSLIQIIQRFQSHIIWRVHLFAWLLNLLFWANIIYLLLIPFNWMKNRLQKTA